MGTNNVRESHITGESLGKCIYPRAFLNLSDAFSIKKPENKTMIDDCVSKVDNLLS